MPGATRLPASGPQLLARTSRPRCRAQPVEGVDGALQVRPCLGPAAAPAQVLPEEQVRPGLLERLARQRMGGQGGAEVVLRLPAPRDQRGGAFVQGGRQRVAHRGQEAVQLGVPSSGLRIVPGADQRLDEVHARRQDGITQPASEEPDIRGRGQVGDRIPEAAIHERPQPEGAVEGGQSTPVPAPGPDLAQALGVDAQHLVVAALGSQLDGQGGHAQPGLDQAGGLGLRAPRQQERARGLPVPPGLGPPSLDAVQAGEQARVPLRPLRRDEEAVGGLRADVEEDVVEADGAHQHRQVHRPGVGGARGVDRILAQGHRPGHLPVLEECCGQDGAGRPRWIGPLRIRPAPEVELCVPLGGVQGGLGVTELQGDADDVEQQRGHQVRRGPLGQLDLSQDGRQCRLGVDVGPLLGPDARDVRGRPGIEAVIGHDLHEELGDGQAHVEGHPDRRQREGDTV